MTGSEPILLVVATTMGGLAAQVIARVRCICKPDADGNRVCLSGCTDGKLVHEEHQLDVTEYELGGRHVLILTSKE